jgi:hypothetical protein
MDCLDYSWWKTNYRGASIADFFADSGVALHAAIHDAPAVGVHVDT